MSTNSELRKAKSEEEFQRVVQRRIRDRMERIDNLPPEIRKCVHDYGWHVVKSFMDLGVRKPRHIRHLVETVLDEFSPTRGSPSAQGRRSAMTKTPKKED